MDVGHGSEGIEPVEHGGRFWVEFDGRLISFLSEYDAWNFLGRAFDLPGPCLFEGCHVPGGEIDGLGVGFRFCPWHARAARRVLWRRGRRRKK